MAEQSNSHFVVLFQSWSRSASIAVIAVGVAVLIGWMLDIPLLKSISPGLVTMKANTALAFLLSGTALLLLQQGQADQSKLRIARWCAVAVALIGLLTLSEYLLGRDFGIDQLLFREPEGAVATSTPGRMSPNTALNFLLVGLALRFLDAETGSGHRPAQYFALVALLVALLALLGYIYDVKALYGIAAYTKMALHTVAAFFVVTLGILFARAEHGLLATATGVGAGGELARRLLPAAVVIPTVVGWFASAGARQGFYDTEFRLSLVVLLNILIFSVLIWRNCRPLEQAERALYRLMQETRETVNVLGSAASEIVASTTQLAASASESAAAVSETTTTVEEVRQTAQVASQKAKLVSDSAQKSVQISQSGRKSTEDVGAGMNRIRQQMEAIAASMVRLSEQSQTIGQIIATVEDIATQSNLLAVNAAIEAAKAGEHGKGFGVVAQEVKSLAEQSRQATNQVRTILGDIQKATVTAVMATEQGAKAVEAGNRQAEVAGEAIQALTGSVTEAAQAATQIAASSQQQLVGVDQVAGAMESIRQASAQNVAGAKQLETAAHNLNELGQRLKQMVERYKV